MKKYILLSLASFLLLASCSSDMRGDEKTATADGAFSSSAESGSGSGSDAGLITAGEWNDLENWDFWTNLMLNDTFSEKKEYWGVNPDKRIAVSVVNAGEPVSGAKVELFENGASVATTITDNLGRAELFVDLFESAGALISDYSILVEGTVLGESLVYAEEGVNEVEYNNLTSVKSLVQLSFIVDATGSMGDELEFLKSDLRDVISRSENGLGEYLFESSSVFYRDEGDDYVTKKSEFTSTTNTTINFIKDQSANGGGDFPEAVHSALKTCLNLDWDENAHTKIAFLLLDAPPHYEVDVLRDVRSYIELAATRGIKIIPISASGVDKETEFLMRFMSIVTNGTYVFITNDSGIGNTHITASVGDYEVEYLNDLMVRVIKKYIE